MNHSKTELLANPRFIPPDLLLKFGYSPINGIEFDSTAQALSFYQGGTPRVDLTKVFVDGEFAGDGVEVTILESRTRVNG